MTQIMVTTTSVDTVRILSGKGLFSLFITPPSRDLKVQLQRGGLWPRIGGETLSVVFPGLDSIRGFELFPCSLDNRARDDVAADLRQHIQSWDRLETWPHQQSRIA